MGKRVVDDASLTAIADCIRNAATPIMPLDEITFPDGFADGVWTAYDAGYYDGNMLGYDLGQREGYSDGYDEGEKNGYSEGYQLGEYDGYIVGFDQGRIQGEKDGFANGEACGITKGQQSEYDRFWDAYQRNGTRTNYNNAFSESGWTEETFRPKYDMFPTSAYMMFRYFNSPIDMVEHLDNLGVTFDDSRNSNVNYMYSGCNFTRIGTVTLTNVSSSGDLFAYSPYLHTIDKIKTKESTSYSVSAFTECPRLANITFEGVIGKTINFKWSPKLSRTSIENIMAALSTTASGQSLTLSKTAANNAFTDEEWAALANTRSNWTINLV